MIIYFTGTGNSRYLAEMLAKQLSDEVVDATKLIKDDKTPEFNSEKPYVFVTPTYAWRMPRLFESWISKCSFVGNKLAYFVLNCGNNICAAGNYIEKFCSSINLKYMGTEEVVMPENYIIMFSVPKEDEVTKQIKSATEQILNLTEIISENKSFEKKKVTPFDYLCSRIVNKCFYTFTVHAKKFYATDNCISCGKCVENCMLNNITLVDGKPKWGIECTHCLACLCKCPVNAIEYGRSTKGKRRYEFPNVK